MNRKLKVSRKVIVVVVVLSSLMWVNLRLVMSVRVVRIFIELIRLVVFCMLVML